MRQPPEGLAHDSGYGSTPRKGTVRLATADDRMPQSRPAVSATPYEQKRSASTHSSQSHQRDDERATNI